MAHGANNMFDAKDAGHASNSTTPIGKGIDTRDGIINAGRPCLPFVSATCGVLRHNGAVGAEATA